MWLVFDFEVWLDVILILSYLNTEKKSEQEWEPRRDYWEWWMSWDLKD